MKTSSLPVFPDLHCLPGPAALSFAPLARAKASRFLSLTCNDAPRHDASSMWVNDLPKQRVLEIVAGARTLL